MAWPELVGQGVAEEGQALRQRLREALGPLGSEMDEEMDFGRLEGSGRAGMPRAFTWNPSLPGFPVVNSTCSDFNHGSALHIAASNLCLGAAKCLLEHGANPALRVLPPWPSLSSSFSFLPPAAFPTSRPLQRMGWDRARARTT